MAKKKVTPKTVITPDPKTVKSGVRFDDLDEGDFFIMGGCLRMKTEESYGLEQPAVCLSDGELFDALCDEIVIPVNVAITWTNKV